MFGRSSTSGHPPPTTICRGKRTRLSKIAVSAHNFAVIIASTGPGQSASTERRGRACILLLHFSTSLEFDWQPSNVIRRPLADAVTLVSTPFRAIASAQLSALIPRGTEPRRVTARWHATHSRWMNRER